MYQVYFLQSLRNGKFYIGHTDDLDRRVQEHNSGRGGQYTHQNGPWKLVYNEPHPDRSAAMKRENFLKNIRGYKEKKRIIEMITSDKR
jgi:predicted GIY-YIG superfamily endonuclease